MIRYLLSTSLLLSRTRPLHFTPISLFSDSAEPPASDQHKVKELSSAQNFYRGSIRKININQKGRGKFTEYHLIKLTKLTSKQSQLPLLFEGYYNYLGHLTPISSKTVDKMLTKVMNFKEVPFDEVLDIFRNHNYLAYFPSYRVTALLLHSLSQNQQHLHKLVQILEMSPLIKINRGIINKLLKILDDQNLSNGNFSSIVKLLLQRSSLHIIDKQISSSELFSLISSKIQKRLGHQNVVIQLSNIVKEFIEGIKEKQSQIEDFSSKMAIFSYSFGIHSLFNQHFLKMSDPKRIESVINFVPLNWSNNKIQLLLSRTPTEELKSFLERLKESRANQNQQNTEEEEQKKQEEAQQH